MSNQPELITRPAVEPPRSQISPRPSPLHWLVNPETRSFLLPITGLWVIGLDWLLFSEEAFSLGLSLPLSILAGFALGTAGTFCFQKFFGGDGVLKAMFKALLAGLVVGFPFPIAGTLVGAWILLLAGIRTQTKNASKD